MASKQIRELIEKLESLKRNKKGTLDFNSPNIVFKEQELKSLVKDSSISLVSVKVVATYFQNISLAKFTREELLIMLSFDYSQLENTNVTTPFSNTFDILNPPVDLEGSILDFKEDLITVNLNHRRLLSVNKTKSLSFFINYLISQL